MSELILPSGAPMFPKEPEPQPEQQAPKPSDYWKVDVPKMQDLVKEHGDDSYILYLADAQTHEWRDKDGNTGEYDGDFSAMIKWDGCVHLFEKEWNAGERTGEETYNHICNLDDYIERLIALQTIAKTYFENRRGEWPG
jgi:hypothetical protein